MFTEGHRLNPPFLSLEPERQDMVSGLAGQSVTPLSPLKTLLSLGGSRFPGMQLLGAPVQELAPPLFPALLFAGALRSRTGYLLTLRPTPG